MYVHRYKAPEIYKVYIVWLYMIPMQCAHICHYIMCLAGLEACREAQLSPIVSPCLLSINSCFKRGLLGWWGSGSVTI